MPTEPPTDGVPRPGGPRWLTEYFLTTTIGGALLATLLTLTLGKHIPGLSDPEAIRANGLYPFSIALVVAFGILHSDEIINFNFIFKIKAKYLAMLYVGFYILITFFGGDRFSSLVVLMNALAGFLFLRLAPRRGLRVGARTAITERWFAIRNAYHRSKRRRAAKKFTVYMRKQGKEVSLDSDGRYIDPNGIPRDPNDRNWMN